MMFLSCRTSFSGGSAYRFFLDEVKENKYRYVWLFCQMCLKEGVSKLNRVILSTAKDL